MSGNEWKILKWFSDFLNTSLVSLEAESAEDHVRCEQQSMFTLLTH